MPPLLTGSAVAQAVRVIADVSRIQNYVPGQLALEAEREDLRPGNSALRKIDRQLIAEVRQQAKRVAGWNSDAVWIRIAAGEVIGGRDAI